MNRSLLLALSLVAAQGACAGETVPAPDLSALIECRAQHADFAALAELLGDEARRAKLGLAPLPQANPYMQEFALARPIAAFGHETEHIAFYGENIIAVLDLPDPRPLAKQLQLETAIDTPERAMFGKEVRGTETRGTKGEALYDSAVLNVTNVASHPGKTLAGCSYALDELEEEEAPAPPAND